MLRCAIEADEDWTDELRAAIDLHRTHPYEIPDAIADTLNSRLSMTGKGRHEMKEMVLLALSIGSVGRIDFEALSDYFLAVAE